MRELSDLLGRALARPFAVERMAREASVDAMVVAGASPDFAHLMNDAWDTFSRYGLLRAADAEWSNARRLPSRSFFCRPKSSRRSEGARMNQHDAILPELRGRTGALRRHSARGAPGPPPLLRPHDQARSSTVRTWCRTRSRARYFSLGELASLDSLRPWIFRIAHHRAVDFRRRYDQRMSEPLDEAQVKGDRGERCGRRRSSGLLLPFPYPPFALPPLPLPRALSTPAAIASGRGDPQGRPRSFDGGDRGAAPDSALRPWRRALHRGRGRLRAMKPGTEPSRDPLPPAVLLRRALRRPGLRRYSRHARGGRAPRSRRSARNAPGRAAVGRYYENYGTLCSFRVEPAWFEAVPCSRSSRRCATRRPPT